MLSLMQWLPTFLVSWTLFVIKLRLADPLLKPVNIVMCMCSLPENETKLKYY